MALPFTPRAAFPSLESLPRSYFLGHHQAGLTKMRTLLSSIDMVIECRDYRVPLTSTNPLFEETLAGRERLVVYTKKDLGSNRSAADSQREKLLRQWHHPSEVLFSNHKSRLDIREVLRFTRDYQINSSSLTASRMMIVGMPNVGKSSLLNALRKLGVGKGKAAHTGAQPGITRKIATNVKIIDGQEEGDCVYLLDTPGVFVPYVPDSEAMLKLALCGSVKDSIISPVTLADYLLYHLNKISPTLYGEYHQPTNEVMLLLESVARKTGRLQKGGIPDTEASAMWIIQRWRTGHLGRFVIDEVNEDSIRQQSDSRRHAPSFNQVKKAAKEAKAAKMRLGRNKSDPD